MMRLPFPVRCGLSAVLLLGEFVGLDARQLAAAQPDALSEPVTSLVQKYCVDCHNAGDKTAGLALDRVIKEEPGRHSAIWERVVRKLELRQMPPGSAPRPNERAYDDVIAELTAALDVAAKPNPGRTETFRRLTRTEYQNAIRDLLALEVDATALLPPDESSHGFDNVTVTGLSPMLLKRYISAAQKVSRLAVGGVDRVAAAHTVRIRPDVTQDTHVEGLPLGTRGGALIPYTFSHDGEYEIQIRLMRDRNDNVESLREPHELEVLLDRDRKALFTVAPPPKGENDQSVDANLTARLQVTAGRHNVGVTFLKKAASLIETNRQPLNVHFNFYRHPRLGPAIFEVSILGPLAASSPGDTASRRRIFSSRPSEDQDEESCARRNLAALMRRACRRPVADDDLVRPMEFFRQGRAEGGFDTGMELALCSVLVNPQFLFRIERDPAGTPPRAIYRISDLDLASRLSFFLWSSIPDDLLLDLAVRDELHRPDVLEQQVRRMLADARAQSLVSSFAGQWLYLRNLETVTPDMRLFPDFDDNLRQAFRRETELFFESILREDRSVLDLLRADYTFLNERLAKHYEIPHVYGSQFRRVTFDGNRSRGGLLRQGSILTVTSYATRTSPVLRGKWVLEALLAAPPPPPPENVPALKDNTVSATLAVRERLAEHRAHAACALCHDQIDPAGLALENFDAVGRWRATEAGMPIDVSGGLLPGDQFDGVAGLEQALLDRPELFVRALTEKLQTYALGRGIEPFDAPAVRKIVRDAGNAEYRFSSLIVGIVNSTPFQMRTAP